MILQRRSFQHAGLTFSYLDSLIDAPPLIALHAHWMEAQTFAPLGDLLASDWRLIDHWNDWLASSCPALLIRGKDSRVTQAEHLEEMAARRPNTQLRTLEGGHAAHADHPQVFAAAVRKFLQGLPTGGGVR